MLLLISTRKYPEKTATQPGTNQITARGLVVPLEDIHPQSVLKSERCPWQKWSHADMDVGQKGDMAVMCVKAAIRANKFPLWVCGIVNDDRDLDIKGTDIVVRATRHIQVKYDHKAYPRSEGGSGNLFIQTHECNPLKKYGELSKPAVPSSRLQPMKGNDGHA